MQVKQLEAAIEIPLYEQLGKSIFLTHAGKSVLRFCEQISSQIMNLIKSLMTLKVLMADVCKFQSPLQ